MCVAPLVVLDVLSHTPHIDLYASPKSACASADGAVAHSRDAPTDPHGSHAPRRAARLIRGATAAAPLQSTAVRAWRRLSVPFASLRPSAHAGAVGGRFHVLQIACCMLLWTGMPQLRSHAAHVCAVCVEASARCRRRMGCTQEGDAFPLSSPALSRSTTASRIPCRIDVPVRV